MKYWIFQNNQVTGPFDRDVISQTPGFSSDSLVCPEGRKGTQMGDWQRAGLVPDLAESLLKAARIPALTRAGLERASSATLLPPEPTLRDLAVLGSLQEKVSLLENTLSRLQEELRARDTEISKLKVDLDGKQRAAQEMHAKVSDLETRIAGISALRDDMEHSKEESRQAAAKLEAQDRAIQELRDRPVSSPTSFGGAPMGGPTLPPMGGSSLPPMGGGMGLEEPPAAAPPPAPLSADPFALPASALPPGEAGSEGLVSLSGSSSMPSAIPAGADLAAAADEPKKQHGKPIFIVIAVMAALVTGGVYMMSSKKKGKKAAEPTAAPVLTGGATEPTPPGPNEDLTQAAVDFVKNYQIPGRQENVSMLLEARYPTTGRLSPWMVEKIDSDKYAVNFYASQSELAAAPKPVFQFQVRMRSRLLQGLNPPAITLLNDGTVPPAQAGGGKPRRGRKGRAARSGSGQTVDVSGDILSGLKAGSKAAKKSRPAAVDGPAETQLPPEDSAISDDGGKSAEEATLDELLMPGSEKPKKRR